MDDSYNPYAAPRPVQDLQPAAAQWLANPSVSLNRVATGLQLLFIGNLLLLCASAAGGLIGAFVGASNPRQNAAALLAREYAGLFFALGMIGLGGRLLGLVGKCFCLATPEETRARGTIYVAVALLVISTLCALANRFIEQHQEVLIADMLFAVGASIAFLVYLRQVSTFIARDNLARMARSVLTWTIVYLVGGVVGFGGILMKMAARNGARPRDEDVGIILLLSLVLLAAGIVWLVTYIRYLVLIWKLRAAILEGAAPAYTDPYGRPWAGPSAYYDPSQPPPQQAENNPWA